MTLAKLDKEEAVRCREGDELAWTCVCLLPCLLLELGVWLGKRCWVGQNNSQNTKGDRYSRESCREKKAVEEKGD